MDKLESIKIKPVTRSQLSLNKLLQKIIGIQFVL